METERFTIWYRCNGRPSGTHSGFRSLIDACEAAMDAVFGVWSSADEAKVSDGSDQIVARYSAEMA